MSGLGEAVLEGATDRKLSDEPAIVEMARSISGLPDDTKMTLVPTGPLTNITLFPRTYSGRADRIDRIVLMGGTTVGGNATVYAEFNIWDDPEAAQIVVSSGLHIVMCRLDVTQNGGCGFAFPPFWVTSGVLVMRRARRTPGITCGATCPSWRRRGFRCCRARTKRRLRLLVVARHVDGNARYGGLPCVRVVVAIVTEGVFAIHIDFPLLFFDLCHGVEDKTSRET